MEQRPVLCWAVFLRASHILGLQAFGAPLHLELDLRAFLKRPISGHLDRREVHKDIISVRALDEAIALRGVKPFHNTFFSHEHLLIFCTALMQKTHTHSIEGRHRRHTSPPHIASGSQEYTQLASENLPCTLADRYPGIKSLFVPVVD